MLFFPSCVLLLSYLQNPKRTEPHARLFDRRLSLGEHKQTTSTHLGWLRYSFHNNSGNNNLITEDRDDLTNEIITADDFIPLITGDRSRDIK